MADAVQEKKPWLHWGVQKWVMIFTATSAIGKHLLMGILDMPRPLAYLLSSILALFVTYKYFPNPKLNFTKYALGFSSMMIGLVVTFYVAIPYLEGFMHPVLAYAIPLLSCAVFLFFIFRLLSPEKDVQKPS